MSPRYRQLVCSWLLCGAVACGHERERQAPGPVYRGDIELLLVERCGECHGGRSAGAGEGTGAPEGEAAAGYRVDSYLDVIGCTSDAPATPVVSGKDGVPALLEVLEREDHEDLLDAGERARLGEWIDAGAPLKGGGIHGPGVLDPRSREWHGALAGRDRFGPLLDPEHPGACGRCHDGAPARPAEISRAAAGAPPCSDCHREPEGVLACGTCHGDGAARARPPRDACLFEVASADAHRAHVESTRLRSEPLPCSACHPAADARLRADHGDGDVDIRFDLALAGEGADFDRAGGHCAVSCHARGGERARPSWNESEPLGCGDCHGAPPADHYAGACDDCHAEPDADASALRATELHMNGRVDVGDGSGACGQCHGAGDDPMPRTPSHVLHRESLLTAEIACGECHAVPERIESDGHLDRGQADPADVQFGARARAFGQEPSHASGTCRQVACHGAGLPDGIERALRWDERAVQSCSGCHGLPPAHDHPRDATCASVLCHGSEVRVGPDTPLISASGRDLHIDGKVDLAPRQ
jgi:predicted CxxxxCH...CXXCH cytochrome family protein